MGRENKMGFANYKAKSQTQKRPNRSNREEFLEGNQAFQPINDSITPGGNSNDCEQKVRFMPYYYHDIEKEHSESSKDAIEKERYDWPDDEIEDINRALKDAITHLNRAINYLNGIISNIEQKSKVKIKQRSKVQIEKYKAILKAIQDVRGVLEGTEMLEIFPYKEKNSYGQAQEGFHQISINMKLIKETSNNGNLYFYTLAKTLIHEAFHIIGGCKEGAMDESCEDSVSKEAALTNIYRKKYLRTMEADYFAQFVMQC